MEYGLIGRPICLRAVRRGRFLPILLVLAGSGLVHPARAADTDAGKACDQAAASRFDSERPAGLRGVSIEHIDVKFARSACEAAIAVTPNDKRRLFEYARVLESDNDQRTATTFYTRSADLGYAAAQYALGIFYKEGYGGLAKSDADAAHWFAEAARQGNASAQRWLGIFYQDARGGMVRDINEATRWYERAAAQGDTGAQQKLGEIRRNAQATPPGLPGVTLEQKAAAPNMVQAEAKPPAQDQTQPADTEQPEHLAAPSAAAQAAYEYLARYLNVDRIQFIFSGHFRAVDGDVCIIKANQNLGVLGEIALLVRMADVDLDSPDIKGSSLRALNVAPAGGKFFRVSGYDAQAKRWSEYKNIDTAAFIIGGGNETTIRRAFEALAKGCGAKPNKF